MPEDLKEVFRQMLSVVNDRLYVYDKQGCFIGYVHEMVPKWNEVLKKYNLPESVMYKLGIATPGSFEYVRFTFDKKEAEDWVMKPTNIENTMNVYGICKGNDRV
jgi:hypothetical protein